MTQETSSCLMLAEDEQNTSKVSSLIAKPTQLSEVSNKCLNILYGRLDLNTCKIGIHRPWLVNQ